MLFRSGGDALSKILSSPKIAITTLDLTGNRLGGKGLGNMCPGIRENLILRKIDLSDNAIMSNEVGVEGIKKILRRSL